MEIFRPVPKLTLPIFTTTDLPNFRVGLLTIHFQIQIYILRPAFILKAIRKMDLATIRLEFREVCNSGRFIFTGQYLNGDMKNFIEPAGYVVANFPGRSEQKFTGKFLFPAGQTNISLYFGI